MVASPQNNLSLASMQDAPVAAREWAPVSGSFIRAIGDAIDRIVAKSNIKILDLADVEKNVLEQFPIYQENEDRFRDDLHAALHALDVQQRLTISWNRKVIFADPEGLGEIVEEFVGRVLRQPRKAGYLSDHMVRGNPKVRDFLAPVREAGELYARAHKAIEEEPTRRGIALWLPRALGAPHRLIFPGLFGPSEPLPEQRKVNWGTIFFSACDASIMLPTVVSYLDGRENTFHLKSCHRNAAEFEYKKGSCTYAFGLLAKRFDSGNALLALFYEEAKHDIVLRKADDIIRDCLLALMPQPKRVLRVECDTRQNDYLDNPEPVSKGDRPSVTDGKRVRGADGFISDIMLKLTVGAKEARLNLEYSAVNPASRLTLEEIRAYTDGLFDKLGALLHESKYKGKKEANSAIQAAKASIAEDEASQKIATDLGFSYAIPGTAKG